ncbi:MAG: CAP domain-containing protein [Thermaerobacter sp.]|nr:CAP domain-containing protein [Thermaerobacter sp.]
MRLIGSALLATGLLLPAVPTSAYFSAGSVSMFGYVGTTVQPYTDTTPSAPPSTPPTPPSSGSTTGQSNTGTTPQSQGGAVSEGSVSYFGGTSAIVWVTPQTPTPSSTPASSSTGTQASGSYGTSPIIYWNAVGGTPPSTTTSPITVVGPSSGLTGNPPSDEASLVSQFLAMVNQARAQNGAGPLTDNSVLNSLAQAKAKDLVTYNYFDHYSPRLGWPIDQEEAAGFRAYSMGPENLAEAASVSRAFAMLMASPLHRQNILNTAFTQTGIAIVPVYNGVLIDEMFTGPSY